MADKVLSVIATVRSRLSDLTIRDGQLIFVQDKNRIALDFGGKRVFYNEIQELETDTARTSLLAPVTGSYYFVIDTAVLWTYREGWVQITTPPEEVVFMGAELPELGSVKTLYVDREEKTIKIWDEATASYVAITEHTEGMSAAEVRALFE